jgi:hypothetical protein
MTRVRLKIGLCSAVTSKNYRGQSIEQTGYMRIWASNKKDTRMRSHVVEYPWDQSVLLKCTIFAMIYGVNDDPSKTV